jgi:hypothetical protein
MTDPQRIALQTAGFNPDAPRELLASPDEFRVLHRLVASYNVAVEQHGEGGPHRDLEDALSELTRYTA